MRYQACGVFNIACSSSTGAGDASRERSAAWGTVSSGIARGRRFTQQVCVRLYSSSGRDRPTERRTLELMSAESRWMRDRERESLLGEITFASLDRGECVPPALYRCDAPQSRVQRGLAWRGDALAGVGRVSVESRQRKSCLFIKDSTRMWMWLYQQESLWL